MGMKSFKIWAFVPTVIVLAAIAYLSLWENPVPVPRFHLFEGADKVVYGCVYMGLVWVGCFDIYRRLGHFTKRSLILLLCGAFAWGGLMELLQGAITESRSADWYDFLANDCGAILGLWCGVYWVPRLFRRYKNSPLLQLFDNID